MSDERTKLLEEELATAKAALGFARADNARLIDANMDLGRKLQKAQAELEEMQRHSRSNGEAA